MKPRHIFWIMTDEQRSDTLGTQNPAVSVMPQLDRLAADSVAFSSAITPSPMCIPARTSILSGLLPAASGVWRNRLEPGGSKPAPAVIDWLRMAGYRTVSLGKQHYQLSTPAFAEELTYVLSSHVDYTGYLNGKDHRDYEGVQFPGPTPWILAGTFPGPVEETSEWQLVDRAVQIVQEHDHSVPLLMRLSFNAPHTPVAPPAGYLDRSPPDIPHSPAHLRVDPEWPRWLRLLQGRYTDARWLADADLQSARRHYYAQCAFLDDMIGRFLDFLREVGLYEESIIAFCSDHGAHLGDHGLVQKQSFFSESVTVPFLIRAPGVEPRSVATPVSTISLLPTAGSLAGVACPASFSSIDLAGPITHSQLLPSQPVFSQSRLNPKLLACDDRIVMVQDGTLRGVFDVDAPDDRSLLFDLAADPYELESIDATAAGRPELERLRALATDRP